MAKSSEKYPRLHEITKAEVLLITVAEGDGTSGDPIHEVTYVCQAIDINTDNDYEVIGELYDDYV